MGIPHIGGTYSVFRSLRHGLLAQGVELRWMGVGAADARTLAGDGDRSLGTVVAPGETVDHRQGLALVNHLAAGGYEGVFVNALCGRVSTNFVRYLEPRVRRILIVHTTTFGAYAAARAVRDHVHAAIGVSPRIAGDLIARRGFPASSTVTIPNAVQMERFNVPRRPASDGPVVLFLGRIEDASKGCLLLPRIFARVNRIAGPVRFVVGGDGPDRPELERRCRGLCDVRFLGPVSHEKVPEVLAGADIYIFPSRYEGFGLSLVEAMAAGCVPVASAIRGVTDTIVDDPKAGRLFPIGRWKQAADEIIGLIADPVRRREMSLRAMASVRSRFSADTIARRYLDLMDAVIRAPRPIKPALDVARWRYPAGLRDGWRTRLPEGMKRRLRLMRERLVAGMM